MQDKVHLHLHSCWCNEETIGQNRISFNVILSKTLILCNLQTKESSRKFRLQRRCNTYSTPRTHQPLTLMTSNDTAAPCVTPWTSRRAIHIQLHRMLRRWLPLDQDLFSTSRRNQPLVLRMPKSQLFSEKPMKYLKLDFQCTMRITKYSLIPPLPHPPTTGFHANSPVLVNRSQFIAFQIPKHLVM